MLRKAIECSRPRDAVRLLRRLGMNVQQEAAKMDRQEQADDGEDGGVNPTLSWSQRVDEALKGSS